MNMSNDEQHKEWSLRAAKFKNQRKSDIEALDQIQDTHNDDKK